MITAILLAAGQSSRTGSKNKLLLSYKKKKLIQHAIQNILKSNVDDILVVLGKNKDQIKKVLPKKKIIRTFYNKHYKSGMSASIKLGIKHLSKKTTHFFICLADMPNIKASHYKKMLKASIKQQDVPIVSFYQARQMNPVLFPYSFHQKLKKIQGDIGAKNILKKTEIVKIKVLKSSFFKDLDTVEDFN
jgi:molybdenum cofactor cytidylyltransferase